MAVRELFDSNVPIKTIGIRHGEKKDETLLTREECLRTEDKGDFFRVLADNRDLNYEKYFEEGNMKQCQIEQFTSDIAHRLNVEEIKEKLLEIPYVINELKKCNTFI